MNIAMVVNYTFFSICIILILVLTGCDFFYNPLWQISNDTTTTYTYDISLQENDSSSMRLVHQKTLLPNASHYYSRHILSFLGKFKRNENIPVRVINRITLNEYYNTENTRDSLFLVFKLKNKLKERKYSTIQVTFQSANSQEKIQSHFTIQDMEKVKPSWIDFKIPSKRTQ